MPDNINGEHGGPGIDSASMASARDEEDNMVTTVNARCRLLELPPELRNSIYEYAFSPTTYDGPLDLKVARSPGIPLILTCRTIYNEARSLRGTCARSFLEGTTFDLGNVRWDEGQRLSRLVKESALRSIRSLVFTCRLWGSTWTSEALYESGIWIVRSGNYQDEWVMLSSNEQEVVSELLGKKVSQVYQPLSGSTLDFVKLSQDQVELHSQEGMKMLRQFARGRSLSSDELAAAVRILA